MPMPRTPPEKARMMGNFRQDRHGGYDKTPKGTFSPLKCPAGQSKEVRAAWKAIVEPATWLDGSATPAALAASILYSELLTDPKAFTAAKYAQLRGFCGDLGLTDWRKRQPETDGHQEDPFSAFDA